MKRHILTIAAIAGVSYFMAGADFPSGKQQEVVVPVRKHCRGYTIIEAGKGIDCYGDTVKLIKRYGYYEPAAQLQ